MIPFYPINLGSLGKVGEQALAHILALNLYIPAMLPRGSCMLTHLWFWQ